MSDVVGPFLEASVRVATPLALAALGELAVERSGVINIGLEGVIIAGAFGALVGASTGNVAAGIALGIAAGVLVSAVFAFFVVTLRVDQIITGTAISMLGLGLTGTMYAVIYGSTGAALSSPGLAPLAVPWLSSIPFVGPALFNQSVMTYLLYVLLPSFAWWLYRTASGLSVRAVGESPHAAAAAGISPARVRWGAILFGGVMGGLSGVTLMLTLGTFNEGMSAGRGFIAVAVVVLGRWTPHGIAGAALLFGAASALGVISQTHQWGMPFPVSLALPYVITLIALASLRGRAAAPAALGSRD